MPPVLRTGICQSFSNWRSQESCGRMWSRCQLLCSRLGPKEDVKEKEARLQHLVRRYGIPILYLLGWKEQSSWLTGGRETAVTESQRIRSMNGAVARQSLFTVPQQLYQCYLRWVGMWRRTWCRLDEAVQLPWGSHIKQWSGFGSFSSCLGKRR